MSTDHTHQQLLETILFASKKHRFQKRKNDGGAYITHPIGVANILAEAQVVELAVLQAAVLHDTVEDTDTTLEEIEQKFGPRVAKLVSEVTDDKNLPKAERKRLQIEHAKTNSFESIWIKAADSIDNLSDMLECPPAGWDKARVKGYFVWKKAVFANAKLYNGILKTQLNDLFAQAIDKKDDEEQILRDYLRSMETCGEK